MSKPQSVFPGDVYNKLTVLERSPLKKGCFICKCECGNTKEILGSSLRNENTKSCGCLLQETTGKRFRTHGMFKTKIYAVWNNMKQRCTNPTHKKFKDYGARGINVCKRWLNFQNFYADMGEAPPKHSLERINNNKGYSKSNCKWATIKEQQNNRRICISLTFCGKTLNAVQWAKELGISKGVIYRRFHKGWNVNEILTTPVGKKSK